MALTYEPIQSQTLGSNSTTIDFTNIPQTYTDLVLVINWAQSDAGQSNWLRLGNGSFDSGTNYSITEIRGNGSSATSHRSSNASQLYWGFYVIGNTSQTNTAILHFQNYANTNIYKTILSRNNNASSSTYAGTDATVGLWRSTSAINQIRFGIDASTTYQTGSTFTLYGIKASA